MKQLKEVLIENCVTIGGQKSGKYNTNFLKRCQGCLWSHKGSTFLSTPIE